MLGCVLFMGRQKRVDLIQDSLKLAGIICRPKLRAKLTPAGGFILDVIHRRED